jgi:hypothetical protein
MQRETLKLLDVRGQIGGGLCLGRRKSQERVETADLA